MKAKLVSFGEIHIEGQRYDYDVVIEKGEVRKRRKKPSKAYRARFGHTPLSDQESIPWHGGKLFIGTGAYGSLPVMSEVYEEARRKGVKVIAKPTVEVCRLLEDCSARDLLRWVGRAERKSMCLILRDSPSRFQTGSHKFPRYSRCGLRPGNFPVWTL
jgi:hypothetical protein